MEQSNLAGFIKPHELTKLMDIFKRIQSLTQGNINDWNELDRSLGYSGIEWKVKLYSTSKTPSETEEEGIEDDELVNLFTCVNLLEVKYLRALYMLSAHMPNSIGLVPPPPPGGD